MTAPSPPPKRKDPQKRTPSPALPPTIRSRAALGLSAAAAQGAFRLQHCAECGTAQHPPRDACCACLSGALVWRDAARGGAVIAQTRIHASPDLYFRERLPWRMGAVKLDAGPVVYAHLHGEVARGDRVRMDLRLDRAGQGVFIALPENGSEFMEDDPTLRAMGAHPRHRRILITDGAAPEAPELARALLAAGAAHVFVGQAEGWRRPHGFDGFDETGVSVLKLDVTDAVSLREAAAEFGGKTDILINTARHLRPGGALSGDPVAARDAMEVNALGLMRLAQAFGPAMAARAADGANSAAAFVSVLSTEALSPDPGYGGFAASQAAARSLLQSIRAELAPSGLRVSAVYAGPLEEDWRQPLPPPKLAPRALARAIVDGLERGLEEVVCGDVARDMFERWRRDPFVLERELHGGVS